MQSFNFRSRQQARPFFDLISNITAEEFGHIELVSTAINTMLTGAAEKGNLPDPRHHHVILIGLVMLIWPRISAAGGAPRTRT